MSTDLEPAARVISPRTGEVIEISAPTEALAGWLLDVREHEGALREAKRVVSEEVVSRLDAQARWTEHLPGGLKVSAPSPAPATEYDELALREALYVLVDEGVLSVEAVDRAIVPVVTYKASAAGIRALSKLGGRAQETIQAHSRTVEKRRTVSVGRS